MTRLHRIVQSEGGFHKVGRERKWFQVVQRLGLPPVKSLSTVLRNHYERILLPYDIFKQTGGYVAPEAKPTVKIEEVTNNAFQQRSFLHYYIMYAVSNVDRHSKA